MYYDILVKVVHSEVVDTNGKYTRENIMEYSAIYHDMDKRFCYAIDTDYTITFSVQFNGQTILSEEYVPDAAYQVRVRKLGRFCAKALWGLWPT